MPVSIPQSRYCCRRCNELPAWYVALSLLTILSGSLLTHRITDFWTSPVTDEHERRSKTNFMETTAQPTLFACGAAQRT
jgi:hypothetical protein